MQYKNLKKIFAVGIFLGIMFFSNLLVFAQGNPGANSTGTPTNNPGANATANQTTPSATANNTVIPPGDTKISYSINNPLGVTSIDEVIQKIMAVIVKLAVPVIICLFLYTGFMFITAQGDTTKLKTAKTMLWQVIVGTIIILGAWAIAAAIVTTVSLITG
ncbi:MAG: hypothetical protein WCQ32_01555 [bacterium]